MPRQTKIFIIFALIVAVVSLILLKENEEAISQFSENYVLPVILIFILLLWVSDLFLPKKSMKQLKIKKIKTNKTPKTLSFFQYIYFFPLLVFALMMFLVVISRLGQP